jgi:TolB-like protein/Tfp pilus assembly protein PilF
MVADVAGYSRLMHADEEATHTRLSALLSTVIEPAVSKHGGRIVKHTGDGFLAEFPSAVEAVRAAEHFQAAVRDVTAADPADKRIVFRVGINIGDVIVEANDIFGDGVNIAARLEGIAEPGGICISASARDQVEGKIDLEFADMGEHNLKNISRPVRAYAVRPVGAGAIEPVGTALRQSPAPRLSIVVLPFANIGGDPDQDYFVDGITESLTTDLSRIPGAFVIARNTAFTFKNKAVDTRVLGRELGVRYVMEGSVQGSGNRIRVNAQLIDAATGAHVWAERFDKPRSDIFDMQDEITTRLARTIGVELVAAESRRAERERPGSMDAVDLAMRGWAILNQPKSHAHRGACDLFEDALRRDDRNVEALIGLAAHHSDEVRTFASTNRDGQLRIAETAITKALALAPGNAAAHFVYGNVLHVAGATERSLREFELAISLDRNLAWAYANSGFAKVLLGRAEEAEADLMNAIRLSPRDPGLDRWYALLGIADLFLGRLPPALDRLRKSVELNPNIALMQFFLAAASALSGRDGEARAARDAGLRLDPNFTVARFRDERRSQNPTFLSQRERIYEGLQLAGVPQGD